MREHYLEILGLGPHASDDEIKSAFRELSKKYHPDLNKAADAHDKFIEVKEAYEYLTDEVPDVDYVWTYEDQLAAERERRKQEFIRKRRAERAETLRHHRELLIKINNRFRVFALAILSLNTLLGLDYLLPYKSHKQEILATAKVYKSSRYSKPTYTYDKIFFEDFEMLMGKGDVYGISDYDKALVYATYLLSIPRYAVITKNGRPRTYNQIFGIYNYFGFIIPGMIIIAIVFFGLKKPNEKFNMVIILSFFTFVQAVLYLYAF